MYVYTYVCMELLYWYNINLREDYYDVFIIP